MSGTTIAGAVARVAARRAKPGCAEAYEALLRGMIADMRGSVGFVSAEILPPAGPDGEHQIISRFANEADLRRWDEFEIHAEWLRRLEAVAVDAPRYRVLTGLEAWFAPAVLPTNAPPPRWRMTVVTWLGIFPTASAFLYFVAPWLAFLPFLVRTALLTALITLAMSYAVMPKLARWLRPWLTRS